MPDTPDHIEHAYYRLYVNVVHQALKPGWNRQRILTELGAIGVPAFSGSCPEVYREKAFDGMGWPETAPLPVARSLSDSSLAFLVHPNLTDHDLRFMRDGLSRVLEEASA